MLIRRNESDYAFADIASFAFMSEMKTDEERAEEGLAELLREYPELSSFKEEEDL